MTNMRLCLGLVLQAMVVLSVLGPAYADPSVNEIMDEIMKNPENKNVPAAVVEKATRINERVFAGTVETISDIVKEQNVRPPALLIVGDVIKFYNRVNELRSRLEGKISSH